jgi:hypothetical protein
MVERLLVCTISMHDGRSSPLSLWEKKGNYDAGHDESVVLPGINGSTERK